MARTDVLDLGALALRTGEGRRLELETGLDALRFGGETYAPDRAALPVVLDVSRMTHGGYALRLRARPGLGGPCQRCLEAASVAPELDVREVHQEGGGEELTSPYVRDEELDLHAWLRDALALALPDRILCREDCAGLCPICGADRNADPGHAHEAARDPRWAALDGLRLEG